MNNLLVAIQFLTLIPVKIKSFDEKKLAEAVIYFPLTGLLLGLVLVGANNVLSFLGFQQLAISVILVILLAWLTRGLHLDGLADTLDALLSIKDKTKMLEIMRDSRIGTMGVLGLVSVILLKVAFLCALDRQLVLPSLLLMCALSRWSMAALMFLFPYARDEGKAKSFIQGMNPRIFIFSTLIALSCALFIGGLKGILLMLITCAGVYLMGDFTKKRVGGITGDTIGATNELMEVLILFSICVLERSIYV